MSSSRGLLSRTVKRMSQSETTTKVGTVVVSSLILVAIWAPLLAPYDPSERSGKPFLAPSWLHPLGTNDAGQDILSELIFGSRVSLGVGLTAAALATFVGAVVGISAGYFRRAGLIIDGAIDVVLTLPFLPVLILCAAFVGRGYLQMTVLLGLLIWAPTARVVSSHVAATKQRAFVTASANMGAGRLHQIKMHIVPSASILLIGQFITAICTAILLESSLSFLGLGSPLQKSWGSMLYWAQARGAVLTDAWLWWVLPPGLLIVITSLSFSLLGVSWERRMLRDSV